MSFIMHRNRLSNEEKRIHSDLSWFMMWIQFLRPDVRMSEHWALSRRSFSHMDLHRSARNYVTQRHKSKIVYSHYSTCVFGFAVAAQSLQFSHNYQYAETHFSWTRTLSFSGKPWSQSRLIETAHSDFLTWEFRSIETSDRVAHIPECSCVTYCFGREVKFSIFGDVSQKRRHGENLKRSEFSSTRSWDLLASLCSVIVRGNGWDSYPWQRRYNFLCSHRTPRTIIGMRTSSLPFSRTQ